MFEQRVAWEETLICNFFEHTLLCSCLGRLTWVVVQGQYRIFIHEIFILIWLDVLVTRFSQSIDEIIVGRWQHIGLLLLLQVFVGNCWCCWCCNKICFNWYSMAFNGFAHKWSKKIRFQIICCCCVAYTFGYIAGRVCGNNRTGYYLTTTKNTTTQVKVSYRPCQVGRQLVPVRSFFRLQFF